MRAVSSSASDTLERETLWVDDPELIARMGVPEKEAKEALRMLDAKPSGFPKKEKLWGDRRYWPAVVAYFDSRYGIRLDPPARRERS